MLKEKKIEIGLSRGNHAECGNQEPHIPHMWWEKYNYACPGREGIIEGKIIKIKIIRKIANHFAYFPVWLETIVTIEEVKDENIYI